MFLSDLNLTLNGGSSRDVTINYSGTAIASFGVTGNYQGSLVAPQAVVQLNSSSSWTGSVYARQINFGSSAAAVFH